MKTRILTHFWERPGQRAFSYRGRDYSYRELLIGAERVAARLRERGVGPGDVVGIEAKNSAQWVMVAHGLFWLGAKAALFHVSDGEGVLEGLKARVNPKLLLGEERLQELVGEVVDEESYEPERLQEAYEWRPDEVMTVVFTSGSTGRPKAVGLTVNQFVASAVASGLRLGREHNDHWLCVLSLYHIGGYSIVTRSGLYGTSFELMDGFEVGEVLRCLRERGVTGASFVPTMLHRLLGAKEGRIENELRFALIGGGPVRAEELREARFRGIRALSTYGMSEACSQVTTLGLEDGVEKLHTAGRPLKGAKVRIVGEDEESLSTGEVGRIAVSGPMVIDGYYDEGMPKTERGELLTTDMGYLDEDGYLVVKHRLGARIVTGGKNVDPLEVEGVLRGIDGVKSAVVVGLDDAEWGQVVSALVVLDGRVAAVEDVIGRGGREEGLGEQIAGERETGKIIERIESTCRELLSAYQVPKLIVAVGELPVTATGKVDRRRAQKVAEHLRQRK